MARAWYLKLTPEEAWKKYMGDTVELFISRRSACYRYHIMCRRYAKDVCNSLAGLIPWNSLNILLHCLRNTLTPKLKVRGDLAS